MERLEFLRHVGAWSALGVLASCGAGEGAEGDQSTSEQSATATGLVPPLDRVGVQLYTLRSLMDQDVAATLAAVASIGYREVEFAGYFGHSPEEIRTFLDDAGLSSPAAHVSAEDLSTNLSTSLDVAETLGQRWLVLPFIPEDQRTVDGYRGAAELLNRAGEVASARGIRIGYHNHAFEFDPVGDSNGMAILLEELDPNLVDIEIDLHWSSVAGADALELFAAHPGRFPLSHVKGMATGGQMVDVGDGIIDWAGLFARSEQAGLVHYFVEHDSPADPLVSVERSFRFLTGT